MAIYVFITLERGCLDLFGKINHVVWYDAEPNGSMYTLCAVTNHVKVKTRYLTLIWVFYVGIDQGLDRS